MKPIIKIPNTKIDILLESIGIIILILFWLMIIFTYQDLPNTIPTHFNLKGVADGFEDKSSTFILGGVVTVLFIGLTILTKHPHTFNYSVKITPENAEFQYKNATRMIRVLKISILIIFIIIEFNTILMIKEKTNQIRTWVLPFTLLLIFIPILYFCFNSKKLK